MAEEVKKEETEIKETPEEEAKKKKVFWAKLTVFILFGFIGPIIYLITRYNLFRPSSGTVIGLWGCVVFAILVGLVGTLCWYYLESMKFKYSIWKQIIRGVIKVECPLLIAALFLTLVKNNVDMMIESLYVFMGFEAIAIVFNPLPEWSFNHNIDGASSIAKTIYDKIKKENSNTETSGEPK